MSPDGWPSGICDLHCASGSAPTIHRDEISIAAPKGGDNSDMTVAIRLPELVLCE